MSRAVATSLLVVFASFGLVVMAQRLSGWAFLSDDPDAEEEKALKKIQRLR